MAIGNKEIVKEMQTHPKVAVIILHLKDIKCLVDCIASLNKITYQNYNIIIVHNGPKNTTLLNALTPISQHISRVIDTEENLGFARGNNIGIRQALQGGADYILLLNDDTEVAPDFLSALIDVAELHPDAGMLGSKILFYDQPQKIWFAGARFDSKNCKVINVGVDQIEQNEDSVLVESDYIPGCALLVKKKVIEKTGLLDEGFFLYWEDVDWGLRCIKAGFKNLMVTRSLIWHKASSSSGGMNSLPRVYHKRQSHLYMAKLHAPQTLCKLQRDTFRDIVWLLFKSPGPSRIKKAGACFFAMMDYHSGKTGSGPHWLWTE